MISSFIVIELREEILRPTKLEKVNVKTALSQIALRQFRKCIHMNTR